MNEKTKEISKVDEDPFGGFEFGGYTFWIECNSFQLSRNWDQDPIIKRNTQEVSKSILGKAITESSVKVIGTDIRSKNFHLHIYSNENIKEVWEFQRNDYLTEDKPHEKLIKLKKFMEEACNNKPPTAYLGYYNSEQGKDESGQWYIELYVSPSVMQQLEHDISLNKINKIQVGVQWIASLVYSQHAPAHWNTWGLIQQKDKNSPEALQGYLKYVNWKLSNGSTLESKEESISQTENAKVQSLPYAINQSQDYIMKLIADSLDAFSKKVSMAFIIMAVIIIISYLFR